MNRLLIAYKALTELGIQPVTLNALYRLGLASGHYRRREKREERREQREEISSLRPLFSFPRREDLLVVIGKDGKTALLAEWSSLQDARRDYPHADGVRTARRDTLTVFNIGGNKYRLVARIRYDYQLVNVRAVLTHQEYDEGQWKE